MQGKKKGGNKTGIGKFVSRESWSSYSNAFYGAPGAQPAVADVIVSHGNIK